MALPTVNERSGAPNVTSGGPGLMADIKGSLLEIANDIRLSKLERDLTTKESNDIEKHLEMTNFHLMATNNLITEHLGKGLEAAFNEQNAILRSIEQSLSGPSDVERFRTQTANRRESRALALPGPGGQRAPGTGGMLALPGPQTSQPQPLPKPKEGGFFNFVKKNATKIATGIAGGSALAFAFGTEYFSEIPEIRSRLQKDLDAGKISKERFDERSANLDKQESGAMGGMIGGGGGALAGAAAGAALGSVVPVVGTAIGALVGGFLGGTGGALAGEALGEEEREFGLFGETKVAKEANEKKYAARVKVPFKRPVQKILGMKLPLEEYFIDPQATPKGTYYGYPKRNSKSGVIFKTAAVLMYIEKKLADPNGLTEEEQKANVDAEIGAMGEVGPVKPKPTGLADAVKSIKSFFGFGKPDPLPKTPAPAPVGGLSPGLSSSFNEGAEDDIVEGDTPTGDPIISDGLSRFRDKRAEAAISDLSNPAIRGRMTREERAKARKEASGEGGAAPQSGDMISYEQKTTLLAGEPYTPGTPLTVFQYSAVLNGLQMGNVYGAQLMKDFKAGEQNYNEYIKGKQAEAQARYDAMSPEEKAAHDEKVANFNFGGPIQKGQTGLVGEGPDGIPNTDDDRAELFTAPQTGKIVPNNQLQRNKYSGSLMSSLDKIITDDTGQTNFSSTLSTNFGENKTQFIQEAVREDVKNDNQVKVTTSGIFAEAGGDDPPLLAYTDNKGDDTYFENEPITKALFNKITSDAFAGGDLPSIKNVKNKLDRVLSKKIENYVPVQLPGFQFGGAIQKGETGIVGEAGAEAFVPSGAQVNRQFGQFFETAVPAARMMANYMPTFLDGLESAAIEGLANDAFGQGITQEEREVFEKTLATVRAGRPRINAAIEEFQRRDKETGGFAIAPTNNDNRVVNNTNTKVVKNIVAKNNNESLNRVGGSNYGYM